jgi:hypothetical protein
VGAPLARRFVPYWRILGDPSTQRLILLARLPGVRKSATTAV